MAPIPEFADPGEKTTAETKQDWLPFKIGGVLFHLTMPKQFDIAQMVNVLDSGRPLDDAANTGVMLRFAGRLIEYIVDEPPGEDGKLRGRALLLQRLANPRDKFDLVHLTPIFTDLLKGYLGGRPTGSPRGSSASRRQAPSAAPASRVRTPSRRAKT